MPHQVYATISVFLAILSFVPESSGNNHSKPSDRCYAAKPGRDGRDGRDGLPGPPGPSGERLQQSNFYLLVTPNDVKNKRYGNRVRLYESLSTGPSMSFDAENVTIYNRLMRITLAEPNVLKDCTQYVATVTVSHRSPVSLNADMDLSITVSDDRVAVGFEIADQAHTPTFMWATEGLSEQLLDPSLTTYRSQHRHNYEYSPLHTVQVKFGESLSAFGIGKTVSDVSRVAVHQYSKVLKPSMGVYVDIYRNDPYERYIIDYIEARLEKEA